MWGRIYLNIIKLREGAGKCSDVIDIFTMMYIIIILRLILDEFFLKRTTHPHYENIGQTSEDPSAISKSESDSKRALITSNSELSSSGVVNFETKVKLRRTDMGWKINKSDKYLITNKEFRSIFLQFRGRNREGLTCCSSPNYGLLSTTKNSYETMSFVKY